MRVRPGRAGGRGNEARFPLSARAGGSSAEMVVTGKPVRVDPSRNEKGRRRSDPDAALHIRTVVVGPFDQGMLIW